MLPALACLALMAGLPARPGQRPLVAAHDDAQQTESAPAAGRQASVATGPAADPEPAAAAPAHEPDRGFFPFLGTIVPGSGLSAGLGYRDEAILRSPLGAEASAAWSVRGYQRYRLRAGLIGKRRETLSVREAESGLASMFNDAAAKEPGRSLYVEARWRGYRRQPFFGIGAAAEEDDRSAYELSGPGYDLVGQWQATPSFGVSARAGVLESRVEPHGGDREWPPIDRRFDPRRLPGYLAPPRYVVLGAGAALDRRDNPLAPSRGFFLGGTAWRYEAAGRRFDFTRLSLDARALARAGPGAAAVRLLVSADLTGADQAVPFFLLRTLADAETLRGYRTQRWRAAALAHLTLEYRWRIRDLVEVVPFADLASLGDRLGNLSGTHPYSVGLGLRALWAKRVIGRLEVAAGPEGGRVLLSTGPTF